MKTAPYLVILLLVNPIFSALIYIPGIPVNTISLLRAQIALNRWQADLNLNYGKPTENPRKTLYNTQKVDGSLQQLSYELSGYNNAIIGSKNAVVGSNNLIIGNSNTVAGNGNYIFTTGFNTANAKTNGTGTINHTLVSDQWIGQLDRKNEIPTNLHGVIYRTA